MLNIPPVFCAMDFSTPSYYPTYSTHKILFPSSHLVADLNRIKREEKKNKATLAQYSNIPMPGFFVANTVRKSWSSAEVCWTVVDPRGFTVSITSRNLANILESTSITGGLIHSPCVWARQSLDSELVLISTTDADYAKVVKNSASIANIVDFKKIGIGDKVKTLNGVSGEYMGIMTLYGPLHRSSSNDVARATMLRRRHVIKTAPLSFYHTSTDLVLETSPALEKMSKADAVDAINSSIHKSLFRASRAPLIIMTSPANEQVLHVSLPSVDRPSLAIDEISQSEAQQIMDKSTYYPSYMQLVGETVKGDQYVITDSYCAIPKPAGAAPKVYTRKIIKMSACSWECGTVSNLVELHSFVKFYRIVKTVHNIKYF